MACHQLVENWCKMAAAAGGSSAWAIIGYVTGNVFVFFDGNVYSISSVSLETNYIAKKIYPVWVGDTVNVIYEGGVYFQVWLLSVPCILFEIKVVSLWIVAGGLISSSLVYVMNE